MSAEFGMMPIFLITPKKGYDLNSLVYLGQTLFPNDLEEKVPEAVSDINSGAQCVAFEMWTAAAFHFHRATESVLRKYWEAELPGRSHPGNKTIGDYLRALGKARKVRQNSNLHCETSKIYTGILFYTPNIPYPILKKLVL